MSNSWQGEYKNHFEWLESILHWIGNMKIDNGSGAEDWKYTEINIYNFIILNKDVKKTHTNTIHQNHWNKNNENIIKAYHI